MRGASHVNKRSVRASRPPHRWPRMIFGAAVVLTGFLTLMVRLEEVQEGYRLSTLKKEVAELQENNRSLGLEVAELSSRRRLTALAAKFGMAPPARGQVVVVP
jgi:cell division protein FtsL